MNLPDSISQDNYERVLIKIGIWSAGQSCDGLQATASGGPVGYYCVDHRTNRYHDIPPPSLTPEVLWRILDESLKIDGEFVAKVDYQLEADLGIRVDLTTAVLRAALALK